MKAIMGKVFQGKLSHCKKLYKMQNRGVILGTCEGQLLQLNVQDGEVTLFTPYHLPVGGAQERITATMDPEYTEHSKYHSRVDAQDRECSLSFNALESP